MSAVKTYIRHFMLLSKKQEKESGGFNLLMISMLEYTVNTGFVMLTC